jgi:hypothetical protein
MVDHFLLLTAIRSRLKSLLVDTTGSVSLASTATGYSRSSGSFITDGFEVGAEVTPVGFPQTTPGVVVGLTATAMTIEGGRAIQAEGAGRTLKVELPAMRSWENQKFDPIDKRWYIDEDYIPGPVNRVTGGINGEFDVEPTYVIRLYGLASTGVAALYRVSDAILRLFLPNSYMLVSDGHIVYVKSSPAPYKSQVMAEGPSHAVVVITVPLWVRTPRGE